MRKFDFVIDIMKKDMNKVTVEKLPKRKTKDSAGYDFFMPYDEVLQPNEKKLIWTNVKACMERGEVLEVHIRSSLGMKGLELANTVGIIDADYFENPSNDGNIGICIKNTSDVPFLFTAGESIAQGIFKHYLITDDDDCIEERTGGIGSTGK